MDEKKFADADPEVEHFKPGENLPAPKTPPLPAMEMVKSLLEEILDNERKRMRNELYGMGLIFLGILVVILGGGFWLVQNILGQLQTERQISEQSRLTTLEQLSTYGRVAQHTEKRIEGTLEDIKEGKDTLGTQIEEQSQKLDDFHKALAGLEKESRELTELMKSRDAQSREILMEKMKAQEAAIEALRDKIVAAEIQLPDAEEAPPPRTAPPRAAASPLAVKVNKDTVLRLPVPSP